ncbi:hypothetical protein GGR95_001692 [Sulfitobacter undariae]|uniref:GAF domain-containing protein n=1 Tax=Sulfitobacter undariae TaxID=1563671 RepID=A0A7W6GZL6_9RHOB|nr:histidine kinase dimerization/phosphoacceptor domain -containing protein [Sulfitobacter undariae]MBB3994051.1 hypothetical protein [Sulfitobacter undariae]
MRAAPHPDQLERLRTLHQYDILDTPREQGFDDIVALASEICEAPISVVNIIDEDRQWFKAEVGLGARETPLETSICSHVILQEDFVEIPDTLADPRMADNPLCLGDPGLRFYAGARLLASNGLPLGTLCVLDNKPRTLNTFQRKALRVLSQQVIKQLELRRALKNEGDLRAEMDHRIKNSLQATSSLIRIYTRAVEDDTAKQALEAVSRRIDGMSALHEQLQKNSVSGRVEMCEYLKDIVTNLRETRPIASPSHLRLMTSRCLPTPPPMWGLSYLNLSPTQPNTGILTVQQGPCPFLLWLRTACSNLTPSTMVLARLPPHPNPHASVASAATSSPQPPLTLAAR